MLTILLRVTMDVRLWTLWGNFKNEKLGHVCQFWKAMYVTEMYLISYASPYNQWCTILKWGGCDPVSLVRFSFINLLLILPMNQQPIKFTTPWKTGTDSTLTSLKRDEWDVHTQKKGGNYRKPMWCNTITKPRKMMGRGINGPRWTNNEQCQWAHGIIRIGKSAKTTYIILGNQFMTLHKL